MRHLLVAATIATALAGCATGDALAPQPLTPLSRYALQVEPGLDRIALAVRDDGLSHGQAAALDQLAMRYMMSGSGVLRVEAPSGDDPSAAQHAYAVRAALTDAGVPADRLMVVSYAAPDPRAPILAGFETLTAFLPNCANEPRTTGARFDNAASLGLGCAITANMAAQIADPRDIVAPRGMSPADSGRAAVVFDLYRRGEQTSAPQERLVEGGISEAVD